MTLADLQGTAAPVNDHPLFMACAVDWAATESFFNLDLFDPRYTEAEDRQHAFFALTH